MPGKTEFDFVSQRVRRVLETYKVQVDRVSPTHVRATVRNFQMELGGKRADLTAGFNPVETLLSAVGTCFLTALAFVAELSHVTLGSTSMTVEATRQDRPPILVGIQFHLQVEADLEDARLDRIVELAKKNSTVFQTVSLAVPIQGNWVKVAPHSSF